MFGTILTVFLYIAVVTISLLLIGLVLIQPSKGGTGATFGGGPGESVFGAQAGSHLTKATVVMTGIFFILVLTLATVIGRQDPNKRDSAVDALLSQTEAEAEIKAEDKVDDQAETTMTVESTPANPAT